MLHSLSPIYSVTAYTYYYNMYYVSCVPCMQQWVEVPQSSSNSPEQTGGEGLQVGGRDWGWTDVHLDIPQA